MVFEEKQIYKAINDDGIVIYLRVQNCQITDDDDDIQCGWKTETDTVWTLSIFKVQTLVKWRERYEDYGEQTTIYNLFEEEWNQY